MPTPTFFSEGHQSRLQDTLWKIDQKILGALNDGDTYGMLLIADGTVGMSSNASPQILTDWTGTGILNNCEASTENGTLSLGSAGIYTVGCTLSIDAMVNATVTGEIYVDETATGIRGTLAITAGEGYHTIAMGGLIQLTAPQIVTVQISSAGDNTLTFSEGQLWAKQEQD